MLHKELCFVSRTAQWDDRANSSSVSSRAKEDYSAPEGLDDRFRPSVDRDGELIRSSKS